MKHTPVMSTDVSRPLPPIDSPRRPRSPKYRNGKALFAALAVAAVAGCAGAGSGSVAPLTGGARGTENIARALPAVSPTPVPANAIACADKAKGDTHCDVKINPDVPPAPLPVSGLTPAQIRRAYGLKPIVPTAIANGPLIAIVDAFDTPHAEDDLKRFRTQFGLPPCSHEGKCLTIVKAKPIEGAPKPPDGGGSSDAYRATWGDETTLDLAMASIACPTCRLLLVQSPGQDLDSLAQAVNFAASYKPAAISNSWGVPEPGNYRDIDDGARAAFYHPGIAITASTGDMGPGPGQFPASSPYVTAVGGTTLRSKLDDPRGWSETAWKYGSTGHSNIFDKPDWQSMRPGAVARCRTSRSSPITIRAWPCTAPITRAGSCSAAPAPAHPSSPGSMPRPTTMASARSGRRGSMPGARCSTGSRLCR